VQAVLCIVEQLAAIRLVNFGDVFGFFLSTFDQGCNSVDMDGTTHKSLQAMLKTYLEEVVDHVEAELDPAWEALVKSNH
jgi:hypothetical protein